MCQTKFRHGVARWCCCAAMVLLTFSTASHAATLNTLFNTGVNGGGVALVGTGVPDLHYSIITPTGSTAVTVNDPGYPIVPFVWYANNAGSRWISPSGNSDGPSGPYIYRTTFNVPPAAILGSVSITGEWATDDAGTDIRINGTSIGSVTANYAAPTTFSVTSGFVTGPNTLDFYLVNAPGGINPTGLRVDHMVGTFQGVPEPGTAVLLVASGLISATTLRRSRSTILSAS